MSNDLLMFIEELQKALDGLSDYEGVPGIRSAVRDAKYATLTRLTAQLQQDAEELDWTDTQS